MFFTFKEVEKLLTDFGNCHFFLFERANLEKGLGNVDGKN
jgi:hypothetical protein